jgi:hypothetical protein
METPKNERKKSKKGLDTFSPKRPRGRPATVSASAVTGRADNWRGIFEHIWESLWPSFSIARSEDDVHSALKKAREYEGEFKSLAPLMLEVLNDPKFPKRKKPQINFLADSLAGLGIVTPRSCRDICAKERVKRNRAHHIVRFEYYVVCSCGYEGPSANHACLMCNAAIPEEWL